MLCHIVYRLSFYGQLLEQPSVALLSRPTVFFLIVTQCYILWANKWWWWWW